MDTRDRVSAALAAMAVGSAFAGSWIMWGLGAGLLVVSGLLLGIALLITQSASPVIEEGVAVPQEEPAVEGGAPETVQVRMRSPMAIVPIEGAGQ